MANEIELKKAGMKMSLLMGASMSLILSMIGLLSSGSFNPKALLINFVTSFCISFVIGLVVPIRKMSQEFIARRNLKPGSLKARLFETLISDLSYTPMMTFIMVFIAYRQALSHGARISFLPMLLRSECISLIAAFALIWFLSPVLMKIAFREIEIPKER